MFKFYDTIVKVSYELRSSRHRSGRLVSIVVKTRFQALRMVHVTNSSNDNEDNNRKTIPFDDLSSAATNHHHGIQSSLPLRHKKHGCFIGSRIPQTGSGPWTTELLLSYSPGGGDCLPVR